MFHSIIVSSFISNVSISILHMEKLIWNLDFTTHWLWELGALVYPL